MPAPVFADSSSFSPMKRVILALALALAAAAPAGWAQSQVPTLISYSGKVVDASGNGLTAQRTITFRIWDNATATASANRLYSEQQTVSISNGEFSVLIGAGSAVSGEPNAAGITTVADAFAGSTRFLGITVDDGTAAADPEMSPRQQIVTTAFAFRAKVAESVASGAITNAMVANAAVASSQLADAAVSSTKLADLAVLGAKIADSTITTTKIADGAITAAKLAGSIDASKLADGSITTAKLADNAVTSAKIADGSVALADLAPNSVDGSKIVDGSITINDLAWATIDSNRIIDGQVYLSKLGANSVNSEKIVDGSVALVDLAANSVDASKIVPSSIGRDQLSAAVLSSLPKPAAYYYQGVNAEGTVSASRAKGWRIFPVDLQELGNDIDGCRIRMSAQHRVSIYDGRQMEGQINLEQPGMASENANFPNIIYGRATWRRDGSYGNWHWKLNLTAVSDGWNDIGYMQDNWAEIFTFYPGSLATGWPAPWNANQNHNASNANGNGPPQTITLASVRSGGNVVTVTTTSAHVIQVGNSVTLAGVTGVVDGARTVTARTGMTFQFNSTGPDTTYPVSGSSTVTYQPTFNKFMIWVAVHPDVSASVVVYDN